MKRVVVTLLLFILFMKIDAFALDSGALGLGVDLSKNDKDSVIKLLDIREKALEISVSKDDEIEYLRGVIPETRLGTKAVTCAYVSKLSENEGIKVSAVNSTYVNGEAIAQCIITAGLKDVLVKIASPYSISGETSLASVFKAYEKLNNINISEDAKSAAVRELTVISDLGIKIGMQKAVQFINEVTKYSIKEPSKVKGTIYKGISEYEKKFNIVLDDNDKNKVLSVMEAISELDLKVDNINNQQKNISLYINDLSKTTVNKNILERFIDNVLVFLKKVSLIFK